LKPPVTNALKNGTSKQQRAGGDRGLGYTSIRSDITLHPDNAGGTRLSGKHGVVYTDHSHRNPLRLTFSGTNCQKREAHY